MSEIASLKSYEREEEKSIYNNKNNIVQKI